MAGDRLIFLEEICRGYHDALERAGKLLEEVAGHLISTNRILPNLRGKTAVVFDSSEEYIRANYRGIALGPDFACAFPNDAALANLIGHELFHLVSLNPKQDFYQLYATQLNKISFDTWGSLIFYGTKFYEERFFGEKRNDEFMADYQGTVYAVKAGYDPKGAIAAFGGLLKFYPRFRETKRGSLNARNFHPVPFERIEYIIQRLPVFERIKPLSQPINRLREIQKELDCVYP